VPDDRDYRKALHADIDELRVEVVRLAAMVGDVIVRATEALLGYDMDAAADLIMNDDEVDALSIDIEERCFNLLALQQPMASDLRAIVASMKINADIERSGDLMVNVAKGARRMYGVELPPRLRGLIQQMSDEADRLLKLAVDAFSDRNGPLGAALNDIDDRLDLLQGEFVQAIFEAHAAGEIDLQAAVQLAVICRYYERVGDHAVNIGERVRFMADGRLPEHEGAARVKARRALEATEEGFPGTAGNGPVVEGAGTS
jgi:phosphate transport system protein